MTSLDWGPLQIGWKKTLIQTPSSPVITPTNSAQLDTLQDPLSILGEYIEERKELYFQCDPEDDVDELIKADVDSCISDQWQMESLPWWFNSEIKSTMKVV